MACQCMFVIHVGLGWVLCVFGQMGSQWVHLTFGSNISGLTFWLPTNCLVQRMEILCCPENSIVGLEKRKRGQGTKPCRGGPYFHHPTHKPRTGFWEPVNSRKTCLGSRARKAVLTLGPLHQAVLWSLWLDRSPGHHSGELGSPPPWPEQVTSLSVPICKCGIGMEQGKEPRLWNQVDFGLNLAILVALGNLFNPSGPDYFIGKRK